MRNKLAILILFILILGAMAQLKFQKRYRFKQPFPEKKHKIRIGCSSLTPIHCMFCEVFKRTDILKKYGLDGEITFFMYGGDQSKACKSNKIDVTFSCEVPALFHLVNCPDMRIVGTPGSLGRIALIVSKESNIFSVKDLRNKKILVHGGSSATMTIHKWLYDAGLDPGHDVELIYSGKDNIIKKLYNGKGNAIVSWDPWLEMFLERHDFRIIKERPFWSVIFISQPYMEGFPRGAIQYIAALKEALFWATNHKELVSKWVSKRSGLEMNMVKTVMRFNENWLHPKNETRSIDFRLSQKDIKILKECNDFVKKMGHIPTDFDVTTRINLDLMGKK